MFFRRPPDAFSTTQRKLTRVCSNKLVFSFPGIPSAGHMLTWTEPESKGPRGRAKDVRGVLWFTDVWPPHLITPVTTIAWRDSKPWLADISIHTHLQSVQEEKHARVLALSPCWYYYASHHSFEWLTMLSKLHFPQERFIPADGRREFQRKVHSFK